MQFYDESALNPLYFQTGFNMTTLFRQDDLNPQDAAEFLYTLSAAYLDYTDAAGDEEMRCLNDEQHTLTAYCYLDSQVQEGGFVQLIAAGYGEYSQLKSK